MKSLTGKLAVLEGTGKSLNDKLAVLEGKSFKGKLAVLEGKILTVNLAVQLDILKKNINNSKLGALSRETKLVKKTPKVVS